MAHTAANSVLRTDISERIAELVRELGGVIKFAARCNVSPSAVGKWLKPGADLKLSNLLRIAEVANVSLLWLAMGAGPKLLSDSSRHDSLGRAFEQALLNVDGPTRRRILDSLKLDVVVEGKAAITDVPASRSKVGSKTADQQTRKPRPGTASVQVKRRSSAGPSKRGTISTRSV